MSFRINFILSSVLGSLLLVGCSKNENSSNPPNSNKRYSISSEFFCESGYSTIATDSIESIMVTALDTKSRTVTLKSSSKYGYNQSAYNLSDNCFSRQGNGCETNDQLMFNHGGDTKSLSLSSGHFIILDQSAETKYNIITLDSLDSLHLKTFDGTIISKDTIFGNPSTKRKLATGSSIIYNQYQDGSVLLALVNDTWAHENYQLFKIKIERVIGGEEVVLSYQRIAEAPKADFKNFYCSKQAEIKKISAGKTEGEAIVFAGSYGGYASSAFGFDYGINGFDGRFVHSDSNMSFGSGQKCHNNQDELCVTPYVGWVASYWGGVIDLGNKSLNEIDRSSWPNLQSIDPSTAALPMKEDHTYLVSELNDRDYTFGAIQIKEIDPQGRWIKFNWKRVAIEKPFRFITYTQVAIPSNEIFGEVTLESKWGTETHLDIALAKRVSDLISPVAETLYFNVDHNEFGTDNRYFPAYSGIAEVTSQYNSVDSVPVKVMDSLANQFERDVAIKSGAVYVVATESFFAKASLAIQVIEFVPGKSVKLKYKRLYNGQTFPGRWDK